GDAAAIPHVRRDVARLGRWRETVLGLALASPPLIVLFLLIIFPAVNAFTFSLGQVPLDNPVFNTGMHLITSPTPTLAVYQNLLASEFFQADLAITLEVTALSVVFVLVVAYVLALYLRFGPPGLLTRVISTFYLLPMFIPVVIASYAIITFYVDH